MMTWVSDGDGFSYKDFDVDQWSLGVLNILRYALARDYRSLAMPINFEG